MLFVEAVAVYCQNHTEHTDTLCGQSVPHRKHISTTDPNRLMLFGETVTVYCQNHREQINTLYGHSAGALCVEMCDTCIYRLS
jgi:hypothetical protein